MEIIITPFAHAYWRQIKRGNRTYESIPETMKPQVKELAKTDVENKVINVTEYEALIGELYEVVTE